MVYMMVNYQISDMIVNEFDITSYVQTVVVLVFRCRHFVPATSGDIFPFKIRIGNA